MTTSAAVLSGRALGRPRAALGAPRGRDAAARLRGPGDATLALPLPGPGEPRTLLLCGAPEELRAETTTDLALALSAVAAAAFAVHAEQAAERRRGEAEDVELRGQSQRLHARLPGSSLAEPARRRISACP
jgi:hypothetical protein